MGVFDVIRGRKDSQIVGDLTVSRDHHETKHELKEENPENPSSPSSDGGRRYSLEAENEKSIEAHPDEVTAQAQMGVQKAEAAALVWSKKAVYLTYAWIWVCFFMLAFQSSISSNVINKAYASFSSAPQISTANILYSIIGGVIKLPIAKTINIWGRAEGFVFFVGVYVLGLVILAGCNNPDSYAAGYVLYWIGYDAIYLILQIFVADTSGLRNRAFAFAFASTPFICTAFTGPLAAQSFLKMASWRWAYGAFAIIQPFVFLPLAFVFKFYQRKAEKQGIYHSTPSGRTIWQSIVYYFHEFDIIGAILLMAAWILLLLPFSLQQYGRSQYKSPTFIVMVIIGFCLFFVFAAWERWGTRTHFVRYDLLKERTVLGACCLSAVTYFSFYCWDMYFFNFCLVVYDLSVSMAGYMGQIYNVGSCFWGVVFGIWVRLTKHFKYTCLCFGLPLLILGAGLMIHFRGAGDHSDIGYVIMSQIFIAFGGGTLVIGADMAVMASADRDGVPMMLSLLGLFNSLGGSVGYAVAAAIYNNTFPTSLRSNLPDDMKSQTSELFMGGYTEQMQYPMGSPTREAANTAWSTSQFYGSIAATAFLVLAIPCIAVWKDYRVDKKQNKGTVL